MFLENLRKNWYYISWKLLQNYVHKKRCTSSQKDRICIICEAQLHNKTERSYTQLDSRRQVIAFWDRVTTLLKASSTPTKMSKINSGQIQWDIENSEGIHKKGGTSS